MNSYLVTFAKRAPLQFISHLDLTSCWNHALRRSRLPLLFSEGFNPQPRFSIILPLEVGITSECELLEIRLQGSVAPAAIADRLRPVLPNGLAVHHVQPIFYESHRHPSTRITAVAYELTCTGHDAGPLEARWGDATSITRRNKKGHTREFSIKDEVTAFTIAATPANAALRFSLRLQPTGSLRAGELVYHVLAIKPETIIHFARTDITLTP